MIKNSEKTLPSQGYIDGKLVSNYHLLPKEILLSEGWIESVENIPTYDRETQHLVSDGYTIENNLATFNYIVVDNEPTQGEVLQDLIQTLADKGVIF